jgi:hypothetical protein
MGWLAWIFAKILDLLHGGVVKWPIANRRNAMPHRIDRTKFFSKLKLNPDTGCMEWSGKDLKRGYGVFNTTAGQFKAHRVAAYLVGMIEHPRGVPSGHGPAAINVLHKCDNRLCCNPEHLFVGTHQDNMDDMVAKGRSAQQKFVGPPKKLIRRKAQYPTGDKHHRIKLTDAQVADIRTWYAAGIYSQGEMAKMFGVTQSNLSYICSGKSRFDRPPTHLL